MLLYVQELHSELGSSDSSAAGFLMRQDVRDLLQRRPNSHPYYVSNLTHLLHCEQLKGALGGVWWMRL